MIVKYFCRKRTIKSVLQLKDGKRYMCIRHRPDSLTCGNKSCSLEQQKEMRKAINYCRNNDMEVVINTARPPQQDPLHSIPSLVNDLLSDVEVRTVLEVLRIRFLKINICIWLISQKSTVPLRNTILIDDLLETCDTVGKMEERVYMLSKEKGITNREYRTLQDMIRRM